VLTEWGDNPPDGRIALFRGLLTTGNLTLTTPSTWSVYGDTFTMRVTQPTARTRFADNPGPPRSGRTPSMRVPVQVAAAPRAARTDRAADSRAVVTDGGFCTCSGTRGCTCVAQVVSTRWRDVDDGQRAAEEARAATGVGRTGHFPAGAIMIYEPRPRPLSEALAGMPDLRNRLLADHVPDETGHRCRACTTPGTGTPGAHWPCRIREAAEAAQGTT
jgi:hypothetical protein